MVGARLAVATCLFLRCSASLRVALCVTGQLRTFDREAVRESQANRLVGDLRRQASSLDSFLVVSEALTNETRGWLQTLYAPVSIDVTLDVRDHYSQYSMHATCGKRMRERERATGEAYAWAIKSRFDLFFYGPIPKLASLSATAVHSRMRRWPFGERKFHVDALSGEIQTKYRKGCSAPDGGEVRIDDQMAYVPAPFIGAYFDDILSLCYQRGWFPNSRSRHIPDPRDCACCKLTQSLLARNASLAPLVLHFTIVRAEPKYAARAGRGALEGVWTDVPLDETGERQAAFHRYGQSDGLGGRPRAAWCKFLREEPKVLSKHHREFLRRFEPTADGGVPTRGGSDWGRVDPEPDLAGDVSAALTGRLVALKFPILDDITGDLVGYAWAKPQRAASVSLDGPGGRARVVGAKHALSKNAPCDFDVGLATYGADWVLLPEA